MFDRHCIVVAPGVPMYGLWVTMRGPRPLRVLPMSEAPMHAGIWCAVASRGLPEYMQAIWSPLIVR